MFVKVDNVGAERKCSGRMFQVTGSAAQHVLWPSCSLMPGREKSPRAAERRTERLGTFEAGMHSSLR